MALKTTNARAQLEFVLSGLHRTGVHLGLRPHGMDRLEHKWDLDCKCCRDCLEKVVKMLLLFSVIFYHLSTYALVFGKRVKKQRQKNKRDNTDIVLVKEEDLVSLSLCSK